MLRSTPARIALIGGVSGLALSVLNQFTAGAGGGVMVPALERAGVLASILSVLLMLVGVLWERIEPVPALRASLEGVEGFDLDDRLDGGLREELAWGSRMLLTATPAATLLVLWRGRLLLRRGLLPSTLPRDASLSDRDPESTGTGPSVPPFSMGPICRRAMEQGKPISLVDLRLYPGRAEFDSLLPALPSVLVQPLGSEGVLLLGGWSARCFARSDLAWTEGWAQRLTVRLMQASVEVDGIPMAGAALPPARG
jgi:hypothetical protein